MKETPSIILAYSYASAISPVRDLHERKLEMRMQTFAFLEYSSADILMLRRATYGEHCGQNL